MAQLGQRLRKGADNISQSAGFGERHAFRSSKNDIHGASVVQAERDAAQPARENSKWRNKKGQFAKRAKNPSWDKTFLPTRARRKKLSTPWATCLSTVVLEIGPGKGALTEVLARRAKRLIAVELDRMMATELRFKYRLQPHVEIIEADVLKLDFRTVLNRTIGPLNDLRPLKPAPARVVGNLPYYITSDILLRLFEFHDQFDVIVIMVQREVADRIAAAPGSRDYGLLSATAQLYAKIEKLFTLPPERLCTSAQSPFHGVAHDRRAKVCRIADQAGGVYRLFENGIRHEAQDPAQQSEERL